MQSLQTEWSLSKETHLVVGNSDISEMSKLDENYPTFSWEKAENLQTLKP